MVDNNDKLIIILIIMGFIIGIGFLIYDTKNDNILEENKTKACVEACHPFGFHGKVDLVNNDSIFCVCGGVDGATVKTIDDLE